MIESRNIKESSTHSWNLGSDEIEKWLGKERTERLNNAFKYLHLEARKKK